jgi:hypothetical protein
MLATRFSRSAQLRQTHSTHGINESELARIAPSVFAQSAHESRSSRYTYIPTIEVLRGLQREGFQPFFAVQATTRTEGKEGYTKHMLRLRHADQIARSGQDVNEVILINSHDGSSAYQMLAGCFRFVCSNGMVCGNIVEDIRVKHSGKVVGDVIDGAFRILDGFGEVEASKDAFKSMQLTSGEQNAFAQAALAVRFPDHDVAPIAADQVIAPRRYEDRDSSLWTTFQRAQENLVQGGVRVAGRGRRHTRAVNGIDGNVALNRGLWVLAEEMRKLRVAAAA